MVYLPTELECKHQSHPSHRDGAWGWKFLRGKVLVLEAGELYDVQVKEPYSPLSWMETWHNKYLGKELRRQSHPTGHFVTHKEYLGHSLLKPCLSVVIDWHTAYVGLGSWNIKTRVSLLMSSFLTLFFFLVGIQFFPKAGTILFTFLKTLQRAGLHAVSKYMLLMDSFQLPLMLITLKGLGGGITFPSSYPESCICFSSFHLTQGVWMCPFNVPPGFCAFSHTTNAVWQKLGPCCCLASISKGCAVQSIASCCFPDLLCITAWKRVLLWIIQKRERHWTLFYLSVFHGLNALKFYYSEILYRVHIFFSKS